jgi:outer membrane receptor protein involved in Fe transport
LLNLTPGVSTVNVAQNSSNQQFAGNTVGSFSFPSINGQTNRSNLFLLDGLNNQESFGSTYSVPPILDDIQEFKVDSHNDQAQFGGVLGGVVNVVTKSGTNNFHGAAWEFFRNSALDAKNPITGINQLHLNQFGANIGGPVLLPHYNGRNRTFFFGSYEGVRRHEGNANLVFIPTPAEIAGDFRLDPSGKALGQIYNPWSTVPTGQPGAGSRTPFLCLVGTTTPAPVLANKLQAPVGTTTAPAGMAACNILPGGIIDANMQKVAQLLYGGLTPNTTGTKGNYAQTLLNTQDPNSYNIRIDEQWREKDSIFGRFSHIYSPRSVPGIFGQANLNEYWAHQLGIGWNHTFGPTAVLSVQFGRNYGFSTNPVLLPEDLSQKLIQAGAYDQSFACGYTLGPRKCYFNAVRFTNGGFTNNGSAPEEGTSPAIVADIYQWRGNFSKTHNRHTFSMGAEFNTNGFQQTFNQNNLGFGSSQTASASSGTVNGGFSVASFLLGIPGGDTYRNEFETEHGGWVDGFYFQDQWKVTDKLTLNLGARYDVTLVPVYGSAKDGNAPIGNLNLRTGNYELQFVPPSCVTTGNKPPCIPTADGSLPAHVIVSPHEGKFWPNAYDNIQPRVGLAYRLRNSTVLRAGYGRFYDNWAAVIQMAQNQQGTWPRTDQLIVSPNQSAGPPTVFAENPLQGANTTPAPTPFEQNNWFVDPNLKNPYSDQWNFGVQQALPSNTTVTANYVGSRGHRLDVNINGNQATTPAVAGTPIPTTSCVRNPSCVAQLAARFPLPYAFVTHYDVSAGKSWYDALQVSVDKKTTHGLSYLLSYTWSKSLSIGGDEWFSAGSTGATSVQNAYNLAAEKARAGTDLPHIFTAHVVYELPFGQGKAFATNNRVFDAIVGGWQVNGIANFNSGTLFNVLADNTIPNTGAVNGGSERANLVGDPYHGTCRNGASVGTVNCWFNTTAFAIPTCSASQAGFPNSCWGNFSRNVLRSDGRANFDASVFRKFPVTERATVEFRAEAFNLTNSPVWGIPNANVNSSGSLFGVVNTMASGYAPRQMQFALKLYY